MTTTAKDQVFGTDFASNAARSYERYFVPAIGRPLAHDLIEAAALRPGERVLDVGCGTGIVTRLAAEQVAPGGAVAGADLTASMLDVARSIAPPGLPILWYETSAEAMPFPEAAFDVVFCQLALQFVPDKPAAVREMYRVLAAGGRALVSVPAPGPFFSVFETGLSRHVPAAAPFLALVFSLNDPAALERLFRDAGFREVTVRSTPKRLQLPPARDFLWQYLQCTPIGGMVAETSDQVRAALERDVVEGWRAWTEEGGMTYEQPMLWTTARK